MIGDGEGMAEAVVGGGVGHWGGGDAFRAERRWWKTVGALQPPTITLPTFNFKFRGNSAAMVNAHSLYGTVAAGPWLEAAEFLRCAVTSVMPT